MGTNKWLRMIVYDRVPDMRSKDTVRTILTFALSALWHGFYPGYYVTFATGALVVMSARMVSTFEASGCNSIYKNRTSSGKKNVPASFPIKPSFQDYLRFFDFCHHQNFYGLHNISICITWISSKYFLS